MSHILSHACLYMFGKDIDSMIQQMQVMSSTIIIKRPINPVFYYIKIVTHLLQI